MFDIYKKTVTINNVSYELKPLCGKYLPKLYSLLGTFNKDNTEDYLLKMDEKTVATMHEVCLETFKNSYPSEDVEKLNLFVSQNLTQILPVVFEINFKNEA